MTWRGVLLIGLMLLLLAGGVALNTLLYDRALAIHTPNGWQFIATHWAILPQAWPLVILGLLIGGSTAWVAVGTVYLIARDQDHIIERQQAQQALQAAQTRAEHAEAKALQHYQDRLQRIEQREAAALTQLHQAQEIQSQAKHAVQASQQSVREAQHAQAQAEASRDRAYHGFKRLQRKQARRASTPESH